MEWLASVASEGQLMADSFSLYRSAVSTAWAIAGGTGSNPVQDPSISRLVQGYARVRRKADAAKRAARRETIALTAELLAQIAPSAPGAPGEGKRVSPAEIMLWAAACMLTFGLNRCAEIFGATRSRRPPLAASAVQFFARPHDVVHRALCPVGADWGVCVPDHYMVQLGATKADPLGHNAPQMIAAAPAVQALWRWMHIRRDLGGTDGPLFQVPDNSPPLTRVQLFAAVARWHEVATGHLPKVTGKAFRRGGNQSLLASGAPLSLLMEAGRWAGTGMPARYSSQVADAKRGMGASRGMGDLYAAAAAGRQR